MMKRLAILLAASLSVMLASNGDNLDTVQLNGKDCGPEGSATSEGGKDLNRHKNRWQTPSDADMDANASLAAMLAPGQDVNRFDQEKAATIQGIVIDVKAGGNGETCNCGAKNLKERDTHIELGLAAGAPETQRVIVEVTPRLRMVMNKKDVDWTTPTLIKKLKGKWVQVTGWMLFDTAHVAQAENTNPGNDSNWRATCWEIHPVTSFKILDNPPIEAAHFSSASFTALQGLHSAHMARAPNDKAAREKLFKTLLSKFSAEEIKNAEEESNELHPRH